MKNDVLLRRKSEEKIARHEYDVFLCYNKEDQRVVEAIGNQLMNRGLAPWLDAWEIRPGTPWHLHIEKQIEYISSSAVFVGQRGIDPWQQPIIRALLSEFVERGCPVIPVLLSNASNKPKLPLFLKGMEWVDFGDHDSNKDPLDRLIWGITGKRLETPPVSEMESKHSSRVLIASLEESPVAISAIYNILTQKEGFTLDKVVLLHPTGDDFGRAYELVREAIANTCELQYKRLPFRDTNSWKDACIFLKELYTLLQACQGRGDTVYLSLAGGGKSMAALMTSITSFFSCIEHLYYIIDPDEEYFLTIQNLELDLTPLQRKSAMDPNLERFILVDIPLEPRQPINQQLISHLLSATEDELARMQDERVQAVTQESVLVVPLSKFSTVVTQLYTLLKYQEGRNISRVILVYPAHSTEIASKVRVIRQALREEANVPCTYATVPGLEEIDSPDACRRYRAILEKVIDQARENHPDCTIDLVLSEGLEGMIAMTIFAAQKKRFSYIYHMLITDEQLRERIAQQTTVEALADPILREEQRNDRLFLRAYEDEGVYTKCNLFKLPVFTA